MKLQSLKIKAFEITLFFIQANLEVKTTQDMNFSLSFNLMMSRFLQIFTGYICTLSYFKCSHMCDLKSILLHVQMSPYHRHHYLILNRERSLSSCSLFQRCPVNITDKNKNMPKLQYKQKNKGKIYSNKDG